MTEGHPIIGRILVVDDAENMCWVLDRILSERGHAVRTARSAAEALAAAADFDCHVAVVDYRLPDGNGLDLIVEMTRRLPSLRSILMTSYGTPELRQQIRSAGLFGYLDKPFENDAMIRVVEDAVGNHRSGGLLEHQLR